MTKYVVLYKNGEGWEQMEGTWEGANDQAAITAALSKFNFGTTPSAEFVATPARSWKPRKVEPKRAFSFS
jgi:hypothetical protein